MYSIPTFLVSVSPHKLSLVISLIIPFVSSSLLVPAQPIPFLPVSEVVSDGVVCLLQERIVRVPRARSQQLQHPEPIAQLDPQPYGKISEQKQQGKVKHNQRGNKNLEKKHPKVFACS